MPKGEIGGGRGLNVPKRQLCQLVLLLLFTRSRRLPTTNVLIVKKLLHLHTHTWKRAGGDDDDDDDEEVEEEEEEEAGFLSV